MKKNDNLASILTTNQTIKLIISIISKRINVMRL